MPKRWSSVVDSLIRNDSITVKDIACAVAQYMYFESKNYETAQEKLWYAVLMRQLVDAIYPECYGGGTFNIVKERAIKWILDRNYIPWCMDIGISPVWYEQMAYDLMAVARLKEALGLHGRRSRKMKGKSISGLDAANRASQSETPPISPGGPA